MSTCSLEMGYPRTSQAFQILHSPPSVRHNLLGDSVCVMQDRADEGRIPGLINCTSKIWEKIEESLTTLHPTS